MWKIVLFVMQQKYMAKKKKVDINKHWKSTKMIKWGLGIVSVKKIYIYSEM